MTLNEIENQLKKLNDEFDEIFEEVIPHISLNDMTLKEALQSQLPMQLRMESLSKKANYLCDNAEVMVEDVYGKAVKSEMSDNYRSVGIAEARLYANSNTEYKHAKRIHIQARRSRDEIKGCLEVIHSRKYTLHNLTSAIVSDSELKVL